MSSPASALGELLARLEREGMRLGLDSMRALLAALGAPERAVPVVLVGGTNGKGSTAVLLAAMASAAGYRTGLYTSPHLESPEERIRVDGVAIGEDELTARLREVTAAARRAGSGTPTYFEAFTAAAWLHFAHVAADLAIVEVGLGGRLDATNTAEPILSLVTAIDRDHEEQLGPTLGGIAREKAGIFRRGRPALVRAAAPEASAALCAAAQASGAALRHLADEVEVRSRAAFDDGQEVLLRLVRAGEDLLVVRTQLAGPHQVDNVAQAVAAARLLGELGFDRLDLAAITRGAARCRWPGRLERVLLGAGAASGRTVLLDAAHNPAGVAALRAHLDETVGEHDLLFGALADKDVGAMLPPLAATARCVVLTRPPSPRAASPAALHELTPAARLIEEPRAALDAALGAGAASTLVVCGSIYLLGTIRPALRERFGVPAAALAPLY